MPRMSDIVIDTFLSQKDNMNPNSRSNVFELFGFDFMIDEDFRVWLIEVNTPVYLLATSGRFDLSSEAHREILCGELRPPEAITYPVLLAEFEWRTWMVELSQ